MSAEAQGLPRDLKEGQRVEFRLVYDSTGPVSDPAVQEKTGFEARNAKELLDILYRRKINWTRGRRF